MEVFFLGQIENLGHVIVIIVDLRLIDYKFSEGNDKTFSV